MRFAKPVLLLCLLTICLNLRTRAGTNSLVILDSGANCSIRGMSIPDNEIIWVSGSNGHVARSINGGKSWRWMTVTGFEKTDFRDIRAFDSLTAIIMGIGNPALILKTRDGGRSWKKVFNREAPGMFLDAMDFRNSREGICIGDPLDAGDGKKAFFIIRSHDGGESWQQEVPLIVPQPTEGEAVFSASGTNIALLDEPGLDYAFISGGKASNLYLIGRKGGHSRICALPIRKGEETTGAFSMATDRRKHFYCIGGDYKDSAATKDNFAWTLDGGKTWAKPGSMPPNGYRSCIRIIRAQQMVACGTNGVDLCGTPSNWQHISNEGFNVCMVSPDGKQVFFGGGKGRIGWLGL